MRSGPGNELHVVIRRSFDLPLLGREYVLEWEEKQSKYLRTQETTMCIYCPFPLSF